MKRSWSYAAFYDAPDVQQVQVLMAQDPGDSYYCLVTRIDEVAGGNAATDQVHLLLDAAKVRWYRALDLNNIPALDTIATQAHCRIFEAVLGVPAYVALTQALQQNTGHSLDEYSWWMITPWRRNLRGSVRFESFRPPAGNTNPASVAQRGMRHNEYFVRDRLIVPRDLLKIYLYAFREVR